MINVESDVSDNEDAIFGNVTKHHKDRNDTEIDKQVDLSRIHIFTFLDLVLNVDNLQETTFVHQ